MVAAIRQTVTVGPGGVVEIRSPQLQAGTRADVIVLIEAAEPTDTSGDAPQSLAGFIGAGKGCFASVEEADEFIRSERDAWDR